MPNGKRWLEPGGGAGKKPLWQIPEAKPVQWFAPNEFQWLRNLFTRPIPTPTTTPAPTVDARTGVMTPVIPGQLWQGIDGQYYDEKLNVVPYARVTQLWDTYQTQKQAMEQPERMNAAQLEQARLGWEEARLAREEFEWGKTKTAQQQALAEAQLKAGQVGTEEQERLQMQSALLGLLGDIVRHPRNWIQAHLANQIITQLQFLMRKREGGGETYTIARSPEEAAAKGATTWVPWEEAHAEEVRQLEAHRANLIYPAPTEQSVIGAVVAQEKGFATGLGGGGEGPPELEGLPPTPEWLTKYAPTLKAGQKLRAVPVTTPSGQQWSGMPYTEQQQLAGYLDWAAGEGAFRDLQEQMAKMIPRLPTLGSRWSPARQRI